EAEAVEEIPEPCEQALPSLAAEAAEREVIAAMAGSVAFSAIRLPELALAVEAEAVEEIPEPCEQALPSLAAEAAEREVIAAMAGSMAFGAIRLPELTVAVEAEAVEQIPEPCQQLMPALAAEAAEREVIPAVALRRETSGLRLPELGLSVDGATLARVLEFRRPQVSQSPAAEAALAAEELAATGAARLPGMSLAVEAEALEQVPEPCHQPMPSQPAEPAERELIPAVAQVWGTVELRRPGWQFQIATHIPSTRRWRHSQAPQAAVVGVESQLRMTPLPALRYPSMAELEPVSDSLVNSRPTEMAEPVASFEGPLAPWPAESLPALAGFVAMSVPFGRMLRLPALTLSQTELAPSSYDSALAAKAPAAEEPRAVALAERIERGDRTIPMAGFQALDFYCETGTGAPSTRLDWAISPTVVVLPNWGLRTTGYQKEEPSILRPKSPTPSKWRVKLSAQMSVVAKIAACLMAITSLWLGGRMIHSMRAGSISARNLEARSGDSLLTPLTPAEAAARQAAATGPIASVRRAIADRAALEVTDTFENGMQAWGAGPKGWVKGWSRDPAGFVRPGELAVFRPTLGYKDYRLEFFGLIESKSMGWMVRARDGQNYYAMKFNTLEAGLRPIISVAHYPVIDGQPGHRVDVPLNVMVHNNTPYHVAVTVHGNRVSTSIEGQEVDSWTDDALLATGGVGFFTDAGARARLYWMKVFKNDDLLGRICGYLSGSDGRADTAELWGIPGPAAPRPTAPEPRPDAALEVAMGGVSYAGWGKNSNRGRQEPWS
ncbi:MAG TPA: hypothetical protein VME43_33630, partial [Bryobacteraceae bacterium]|nr:hypothetical protein [Bryobacteraceae bacterium]